MTQFQARTPPSLGRIARPQEWPERGLTSATCAAHTAGGSDGGLTLDGSWAA